MVFAKKVASVLSLAFFTAMAMVIVFSSFTAADYCHSIGTCNLRVCYQFCLSKNYTGNNFQTYCLLPGINRNPSCCCRLPGADGRA
ncbi:hypothetical protein BDA96_01G171900 [Sorghum bicolor]|uniref:Uncharacterized protein n=2 Tax=Sorghum bicolor TaxID=4558 RepID=A0A921UYW4_SORBI|nr:hypothetical protein BDA96_01G171900 [Sorghum bicolor]OQU91334.1 hypothetical protein SORBI_3001G163732 [Sorghum bicolor]